MSSNRKSSLALSLGRGLGMPLPVLSGGGGSPGGGSGGGSNDPVAVTLRLIATFVNDTAGPFSNTLPAGTQFVRISAVGGGGGGWTAASGTGGGGGGGFARKLRAATAGAVITGTVGAGGAAATNGGSTSVDGMLAGGGIAGSGAGGGAGGGASGGDVNYGGGAGNLAGGGAGGENGVGEAGSAGGPGKGSGPFSGGGGALATAGRAYGGGGGRADGSAPAGAGAGGVVVVEAYAVELSDGTPVAQDGLVTIAKLTRIKSFHAGAAGTGSFTLPEGTQFALITAIGAGSGGDSGNNGSGLGGSGGGFAQKMRRATPGEVLAYTVGAGGALNGGPGGASSIDGMVANGGVRGGPAATAIGGDINKKGGYNTNVFYNGGMPPGGENGDGPVDTMTLTPTTAYAAAYGSPGWGGSGGNHTDTYEGAAGSAGGVFVEAYTVELVPNQSTVKGLRLLQTFTRATSGAFSSTAPAGAQFARITAIGGGGGGQGYGGDGHYGGGGGFAQKVRRVSVGEVIAGTVAAGGAGGSGLYGPTDSRNWGADGGTTTVDGMTATGGTGGTPTGGLGGVGSGGDINANGAPAKGARAPGSENGNATPGAFNMLLHSGGAEFGAGAPGWGGLSALSDQLNLRDGHSGGTGMVVIEYFAVDEAVVPNDNFAGTITPVVMNDGANNVYGGGNQYFANTWTATGGATGYSYPMFPVRGITGIKQARFDGSKLWVLTGTGKVYRIDNGVPTLISVGPMKDLAVLSNTALMVGTDGKLWAYGYYGHLTGLNTTGQVTTVTRVGTDTDWDSVTIDHLTTMDGVSWIQSCAFARKTDGRVYATGYNSHGQLGLGDRTNRLTWVQVPGTWRTLPSVFRSFVVAVRSDGNIYGWGQGADFSANGDGPGDYLSPTAYTVGKDFADVTAYSIGVGTGGVLTAYHAIASNGTLWYATAFYSGMMVSLSLNRGDGVAITEAIPSGTPVQIGSRNDWAKIIHYAASSGGGANPIGGFFAITQAGQLWRTQPGGGLDPGQPGTTALTLHNALIGKTVRDAMTWCFSSGGATPQAFFTIQE